MIDGKPVVSRRDPLPVLEPSEHALDDVPASVCCAVERVDDGSRGAAEDDGFDAFILRPGAQAISVIGPVGDQQFGRREGFQHRHLAEPPLST